MSTATRIIKNSGFLYVKMGINVFISLYTTRLILSSLGAADFGIFNIIGGAIGMLGFLNSTLANATQRFMSYAEGEGNLESKVKIFNISFALHFVVAIATALLLFGIMPLLFGDVLNIESERIEAAKVIYYSLIVSTVVTIINVPYDAVMNAHENMLYYSIIGIFESVLKLLIAFVCVYTTYDKLIIYGILMAFLPIITLTIMKVYCHKKYDECVLSPIKYWDSRMVRSIGAYSTWNFLTAISSLFSVQGVNLVLNHFYGTTLNAAQGIANQLNGQLTSFSSTMLKALNPVIVKNAGSKNYDSFKSVTISGSKFSVLLIMLFAVPFIIEINYILSIWLENVPEWTSVFCILQLIQTVICQVANPAATALYAQGDIKNYAIYKSLMNFLPLIFTYVSFSFGASPLWLYIPMIAFWAIGGDMIIFYYLKVKCHINFNDMFKSVVLPVLFIGINMFVVGIVPSLFMSDCFSRLIITTVLTSLSLLFTTYKIGLNINERQYIIGIFNAIKQR